MYIYVYIYICVYIYIYIHGLILFKVVKRMNKSLFMSKHVAQSDRLTLSPHENNIAFRMISVSFIHFIETKRNVTLKYRGPC